MMKGLAGRLMSPHSLTLAAFMAARAAGFLASFVIARSAGVVALGAYSTVVNTAALAVSPFTGVIQNNGALLGAEARRAGDGSFARVACASLLVALGIAVVSVAGYFLLSRFLTPTFAGSNGMRTLASSAAVASIVGQLCGGISIGLFQGSGRHRLCAAVVGVISILALVATVPVVAAFGLVGAFALLIFVAIAPSLALAFAFLPLQATERRPGPSLAKDVRRVLSQLLRSLPSTGAAITAAVVYWLCGTLLMQRWHGPQGVALASVAMQWYTLMLMPITSWGGLSIQALDHAFARGAKSARWPAIRRVLRQNVSVTALVAGSIAACAVWISAAYRLQDQPLAPMIWLLGVNSVVVAVNSVLERMFLRGRGPWVWWLATLCGSVAQLGVCLSLLKVSVLAWPVGLLIGNLAAMAVCAMAARSLVASDSYGVSR